jgi:glutathione S-transferase
MMFRLVYFPVPGRAEACRVALAFSGVEWEDVEVTGVRFEIMKNDGELPWDMLPILQTPDGTIAESSAILRFAGHDAGLIPENRFQAAKVDEFIDGMGPLATALNTTFGISDVEERIRLRKKLFTPQGAGTKNLALLERKISQSQTGWAAGTDEMTIADLKLFTELFALFSGNYDGIETSVISDYPQLLKYHEKVANEPRVKAHYAAVNSNDLRWTFLPGAFANL